MRDSNAFICNECVDLCSEVIQESKPRKIQPGELPRLMPPAEIKKTLDEYVIGQERVKRALCVAVYNHYKRIRSNASKHPDVDCKSPTSCWLDRPAPARPISLRFRADFEGALCDSGRNLLTEAGYVGEDVENILLRLIQAAGGNVQAAEQGIIYLDEVDKIARKSEKCLHYPRCVR